MSAGRTARERVRAELTHEIVETARSQLGTRGAAGVSLRAVAREMGMVSSAIHRYFPTRDDLLSALIIQGYDALGSAIETADSSRARCDYAGRWLAVAHAVRAWALAHPHEYALIYGSPVPDYRAPQTTIRPAGRGVTVFGQIISQAYQAGALDPPDLGPPPPPALAEDAERMRQAVMLAVPDDVLTRAITAWTGLFGHVSFELFGQFANTIECRAELFEHSMARLGRFTGLRW